MTQERDPAATATANPVDTVKLALMLTELRLPTMKQWWQSIGERADAEGWPAARFLSALAEHELAERERRRIHRHLSEARLLPGKTLANFDFPAVPMISKAQVMALACRIQQSKRPLAISKQLGNHPLCRSVNCVILIDARIILIVALHAHGPRAARP